ncbi:MAG: DUF5685 family protein [Lachnospiraceae bacterium]|nr:DUF5685 family protein [Lachnospiraceae bacterium]
MFGYIYVNEQELKLREYTEYRSFYCGLCQELHHRYGRRAQMVLNYDTTFLAVLLTGLYEPETLTEEKRCIVHPVHRHPMVCNDAIAYAADMCVLLAYQKSLDDWEDERKPTGCVMASLLKSAYDKIATAYPRQAKAVEENIRLLHEVETAWRDGAVLSGRGTDIDYVSGLTGNFLAELFVWKDDIWQDDLRQIGFYLGKFIYLMDAVEDIEKDKKRGNYNVFSAMLQNERSQETASGASGEETVKESVGKDAFGTGDIWENPDKDEIQRILIGMMTEASRAFERLPVLQYEPIIRNILYSGVWCKYSALQEKAGRKREKDGTRHR